MEINIWPNPSSGKLFVCGTEEGVEVAIYTPDGKKVHSFSPVNTHSIIDLAEQPEGVYFMVLSSPKEGGCRRKIVLEK